MVDAEELDENSREIKASLRERVRSERRELTPEATAAATAGFTEQLITLATARGARTVAGYLPVRSEPDINPFLQWCRDNDIRTLLPSCRPDMLLDWVEPQGSETVPGMYGIPEPVGEVFSPNEVFQADVILVPAAAVDEHGVRLGWGGGFYDRTLGSMLDRPDTFAVVNDTEIYDSLPREVHDVRVTGAVTPTSILYFDRETLPSQAPKTESITLPNLDGS